MLKEIMKDESKKIYLAKIVGHLMGDGCVTKRYLRYNNKDETLISNFVVYFKNIFSKKNFIYGKVNSGTKFVQIQNKKIISFLFNLCEDFRSENLRIPKFVQNLELKKQFIRAIFDDEGCVGLRTFIKTGEIKRNLEIASKSKLFLEQIKEILNKDFGIKTNRIISFGKKVGDKEFLTWKLSITGKENFIKFKEKINFSSEIKKEKLEKMINSYKNK